MLSNTATPKYYGAFRDSVLRGEIPVCETIEMEMNRIDKLIRNPKYYYDPNKVEGFIEFCESELTLTNGDDLHLLPSFKLWAEEVYGWYYFKEKQVFVPYRNRKGGRYVRKRVKKRLIKKQYLIVARGAAKTLYDVCHQAYGLIIDGETTHQVTCAYTMIQAEEVLGPFRTAIARARGPVFQFLTEGSLQNTTGDKKDRQKLSPTKKGIENFLTNSLLEVRPMSIPKLQGLQNKYSTVDEWLSGDIREDVIGALEQGASKLDDYLIISTSSEGTIRNGVGDSIKMELMDILKGTYQAPHISIWWYKLDDIKEINNPELWIKANPNIGRTVSYEVYQEEVERAEKVPSARNDILAKRFGIPTEGYTYFFTYDEILPTRRYVKANGLQCSMGADLSQGDDFCAFTFAFPMKRVDRFIVKTRAFITERTLNRLPLAMRDKYQHFINEESLVIMPGTTLDLMEVYDDIDAFIEKMDYDVCSFGYDPYNALSFVERWEKEHGPYGIVKVPQGARTESVPLGEIKKMAEDGGLVFDQELFSWSMGNCVVLEDTNGNRKLWKMRRDQKIDSVAALIDAYVAFKANPDAFE